MPSSGGTFNTVAGKDHEKVLLQILASFYSNQKENPHSGDSQLYRSLLITHYVLRIFSYR